MSPRSRHPVGGILAVVLCLGVLTGCRKQQAETPATLPAPEAGKVGPEAPPRDATATPDQPRPEGVDSQDDPNAPPCLPRSYDVGEWYKSEPVRVANTAGLDEVASEGEVARLSHYRITSAALCAYTRGSGSRAVGPVHVLLIETESPDDAYGLMTCQSNSREIVQIGGETRVDRGEGLHYHCWRGRSYAHVWLDVPFSGSAEAMLPLLRVIAGRIPREDPPVLLEAMPRDHATAGCRWLVRHLGSLSPGALGMADPPDLAKVNALLGLGTATLMCIASYEVPEARRPNVVWLVRYPTARRAEEAYERYARQLTRAAGQAWESTSLMRPHGPFLIGTWTVDEESLQYMMPRIKQLLPS